MTELKISDITTTPGPRYSADGRNPYSGEWFRDEHLIKAYESALNQGQKLTINLNGVEGYGPSFLEEAFGGMVREYDKRDLLEHITIISDEVPSYGEEVIQYIKDELSKLEQ